MKKYLSICAFILSATQTFAQVDPIRQKLDSIFQHINKSQVPTGYLKEYGAEMMPLYWFKGVMTDSNFVANIDASAMVRGSRNILFSCLMPRLLNLCSSSFNDLCQQHSATTSINLQKGQRHIYDPTFLA